MAQVVVAGAFDMGLFDVSALSLSFSDDVFGTGAIPLPLGSLQFNYEDTVDLTLAVATHGATVFGSGLTVSGGQVTGGTISALSVSHDFGQTGAWMTVLGLGAPVSALAAAIQTAGTSDDLLGLRQLLSGNDQIGVTIAQSESLTLFGAAGNDTVNGSLGADRLKGDGGQDRLNGDQGSDRLWGGGGQDSLNGGASGDRLFGGLGSDNLSGGTGADRLTGGTGADTLDGGAGADHFIFAAAADSPFGGARDTILGFVSGQDKIDLTGFAPGIAFTGTTATAGAAWTFTFGGITTLSVDSSGDGIPDLEVNFTPVVVLTAADFV